MKDSLKKASLLTFGLLSFSMTQTYAVNGAFDFGFSEITRGMAGAGSALPRDTIIPALNPAGLVKIKKQFDIGAAIYFPTMHYIAGSSPGGFQVAQGDVKSDVTLYFLPDAGVNLPIDDKSTFGVSLYSLGGFGVRYKTNAPGGMGGTGPFGDGTLRSDLKQSVASFTYARQISDKLSLGASALMGLQTFSIRGVNSLNVFSNYQNNVSNKGTDYSIGAGVRLGVLYQVLNDLDISAAYQPKVYMTKLSKYKGLLPNGGKFDMPAYGNIGLAWHLNPRLVLVGDIEKIWFKDIPAYGNSHAALLPPGGSCATGKESTCLGGKNGAGFGWDNAVIYKIGAEWQALPKTTLRIGYNHSNRVLDRNYATENMITTGALVRNIYTIGGTQQLSDRDSLNFMAVYIPKQSLGSVNQFGANQTVTTTTKGIGFGISWSRTLA